jgi:CubicO group peptidase (beta-lactamase class C family)
MDHTALKEGLQREIDALVRGNQDIFNAVIGIVNNQAGFSWAGAAGTADSETGEEMKVDTPIFIASITKMYTGAALMILEESGSLSLDDRISKHLPERLVDGLHRYKGWDYSDQLRVYHLISQTSGLPDYFMEKPKGGKSVFDQLVVDNDMAWDLEQVVDIVKNDLSSKFPPESKEDVQSGKKAYYADTNYQLLGAVIEAATQKPLHEVFSELFLEPLALSSTYLFGHGDMADERHPAEIYYKSWPLHIDKAMTSFGPDGGMVSNVEDSLTFLENFIEGRLFTNPSTLERMQNWKKVFFPLQYGLGLMRFTLPRIFSPFSPAPELVGHSGSTSAFSFYSDREQIYIAGTLNQIENQGRPFRVMLKFIKMVNEGLAKR